MEKLKRSLVVIAVVFIARLLWCLAIHGNAFQDIWLTLVLSFGMGIFSILGSILTKWY